MPEPFSLKKNYRWLYEREWRMFARPSKAFYHDVAWVRRVYLGSRMDPEHRTRILTVFNRLGIKALRMKIDAYSIRFTGIPKP